MQYGIVQEVMKVEERKAVRREQQSRSPVKSPRTNRDKINQDLNVVKTVLDSSFQKQLNFKKNESPLLKQEQSYSKLDRKSSISRSPEIQLQKSQP